MQARSETAQDEEQNIDDNSSLAVGEHDYRRSGKTAHPINDAPEDIIREIFQWICALNKTWTQGWCLSHVCRLWREIAITTPSLWSQVRLRSTIPEDFTLEYWLIMVRRASKMPVTIEVDMKSIMPTMVISHCHLDAFQNLICVTILLGSTPSYLRNAIQWIGCRPVKAIKELCITGSKGRSKQNAWGFNEYLLSRLLTSLSPTKLSLTWLDFNFFPDRLPNIDYFSTIRHLTLRNLYGDDEHYWALLRRSKYTEHITLQNLTLKQAGLEFESIKLEHLSTIELGNSNLPSGFDIHCPNLRRIRLDSDPSGRFLNCLRNSPILTTVEWFVDATGISFRTIDYVSPQVTHILMRTLHPISLLSIEWSGTYLLPSLHCLTIIDSRKYYLDRKELSKLVRTRCLDVDGVLRYGKRVRVLRLEECLGSCDELDDMPWSLMSTEYGSLREYLFD